MNKRANLYLNIYSIVFFLLALSLIGLSITLGEVTFTIPSIVKGSTFLLGIISSLLCIAIELFLFILMTNKYRVIDIIYILLIGISAVLLNIQFPFVGFLIILFIPATKSIFRISQVDKIYIPKEFNRYCKMFNIKIKDFPKKRKTKVKENSKETVKEEVKETIKINTTKETKPKKKTTKKKTVKGYSQEAI